MNKVSYRSALSFLVVGGGATALQYVITALLYTAFHLALGLASAIGFIISALGNYYCNARWTFQSTSSHAVTLPRFAVTACIGLLINTTVITLLLPLGTPAAAAQLIATCTVLLWNYCINALWTFNRMS